MRITRILALVLLLVAAGPAAADIIDKGTVSTPFSFPILTSKTTTGAGDWYANIRSASRTYICRTVGTGAVSSTVQIEGSNDGLAVASNSCSAGNCGICTLTPSATTDGSDSCTSLDKFTYIRANQTAVSGTGATTDCRVSG